MVPLGHLDGETLRVLERLGPHGQGNPAPLLAASGLEVVGRPRTMGKSNDHAAFHVRGPGGPALRAVWFGGADALDALLEGGGPVSLAFRPSLNRFRGSEEVELLVEDARPGIEPAGPGP